MRIQNGEDIKPYLSKKISDLDYNDPLLNDWGIHHLHLGLSIDESDFIERTGPVLFVRFDIKKAYFINIMPHGSWAKHELIKIIHNNWPETIEKFRIKAIYSEKKYTDSEISILRKAGVYTLIEVDQGILYAPIGGGLNTATISTEVVTSCDYYAKKVREFESFVVSNIDSILLKANIENIKSSTKLDISLMIVGKKVFALENNFKFAFEIGTL